MRKRTALVKRDLQWERRSGKERIGAPDTQCSGQALRQPRVPEGLLLSEGWWYYLKAVRAVLSEGAALWGPCRGSVMRTEEQRIIRTVDWSLWDSRSGYGVSSEHQGFTRSQHVQFKGS